MFCFKNVVYVMFIKKIKCVIKMKMENGIVMLLNIVFILFIYCIKFVLVNSKNFFYYKLNFDISFVIVFVLIFIIIVRFEVSVLFLNKDDSINVNVIIINVFIYVLLYVSVIFLSSCVFFFRLVNLKNKVFYINENSK